MTFEERVQKQVERLMRIKPFYKPGTAAKLRQADRRILSCFDDDEARNPTGYAIARAWRAANKRS